jgi:cytochrome c2
MRSQNGLWTVEDLNVFLADPHNVVPGTTMGRGTQSDRAARVAIIAHLTGLTP